MPYGRRTKSSVISCNVSYNSEIDEETLIAILSGELSPEGWWSHLDTFFNELPEQHILDVMIENGLTMAQLVEVFESLPTPFQGKVFKELAEREI